MNCIFCKIVSGEIPAQKTHEDEHFIAFLDINPKGPRHTLLIPKNHHQWFYEMPEEMHDEMFRTARDMARKLKEETQSDYVKLLVDGRDVPHVHVHLIPSSL